ncbi:MAG: hypothetical protein K0R76_884 [Alphaproteobacteria bacterium]|jgi:mitochondrial fission protein ELM1|nr:hypothetical protein [Alphaproteobacteria bacterium]
MNHFFKKIGVFLVAFLLISTSDVQATPAVQAGQTFLYLLYDGTRAGEKNQVLGVANALDKLLPKSTVRKEFDLKDREAFLSAIDKNLAESQNKGIIIAAEAGSIAVLTQLKPRPNIVIVHSSHQYTKDHASLRNVADVVALPQYVITREILEALQSPYTVLVQTAGVPHNLSPRDIQAAYEKDGRNLPSAPSYLGVILGGDAETPDKKILYYTEEEARQLAGYIAPQIRGEKTHLLILNGPRTGKHNQKTGELIATSHRDGRVDAVTAAFVKALKTHGLTPGQDFTLLDFHFGQPSAYPVVLGALKAKKGRILVAGESTSMVSETADCLPGLVTAYINGAMNENHRKHCPSEHAAGRVNILENQGGNWKLVEAAANAHNVGASRPATQIIAEAIMKRLGEKISG